MIAIISDVHGNLPALEVVLEDIDVLGVERIWCLGDTLGYGPFVNECIELVAARCELVLAGNHDLAVRGDLEPARFGGSAGAGVEYARAHLEPANRALLGPLAPAMALTGIELFHASARDPVWEYVRGPAVATAHLKAQTQPLSLVGHSHEQLAFVLPDGEAEAIGGPVAPGAYLELTAGARRVLNPGSVGQPRDRDPRAAWLLLNEGQVQFRRVPYDIPRMRAAVVAAGLPSEIGERLALGW